MARTVSRVSLLALALVFATNFTTAAKAHGWEFEECVRSNHDCHHIGDDNGHPYKVYIDPHSCPEHPHRACYLFHE